MDISVVICAYKDDRWEELQAAVESVRRQTFPSAETIVVVDHNTALLERVRIRLPGASAVENKGPRGLAGARNSGVDAARGEVIAFLDDDAAASPQWLEGIHQGYQDPNVAGVGGTIEPMWESGKPRWFPEEFGWVVGCTYLGMPTEEKPVRNLIGCNMSFRQKIFDELGGFRLGYGCDETEFCIRILQHWPQKLLLYRPQASVQYRVPGDRANLNYFRTRCYFEGRSKAVISWLVGARDGLASERAYTFSTLPRGILRGFSDALLRQDVYGLGRSAAIAFGLAATAAGYLSGKLSVAEAARERGWELQSQ